MIGGVFAVLGLWLLVGRFFFKRYRARRTVYGLTGSRALIAIGNRLTELPLRTAVQQQNAAAIWRPHPPLRAGLRLGAWL